MFCEDVSTLVTSPASNKWFEMREDAKQLSEKKGELFYSVVVKLLFIKKRSRHDLATSVGFLTKRVSNSDVDNWEKFRRILRFVHYTLKRKTCSGAASIDEILTWVDASYVIHHEMKSNTGGAVSMGLGVTHCRSSKQKLNTNIST